MSDWPLVQLDDIAEVSAGNPAPQEQAHFNGEGHPFVRMQDVGRVHIHHNLTETVDHLTDEAISDCRLRLYPEGTLLIPKSGASVNLNHRAMLGRPAYVVSHLATIIPDQGRVEPKYLFHWSTRYDPRKQAQVTSLPSLPLSLIKVAEVPLPPLEEQRRIVGVLDQAAEIRGRAESARVKARDIIPALFLQTFGDPATNRREWPVNQFGAGTRSIDFGISAALSDGTEWGPQKIPVIRIPNINPNGDLVTDDLRFLAVSQRKRDVLSLTSGDILFNWRNAPKWIGKTTVWDGRMEAIFASFLYRIRLKEQMLVPIYVKTLFNILRARGFFESRVRQAVSQANFGRDELAAVVIAYPPLARQTAFAQQAERLEALARSLDAAAAKAEAIAAGVSAEFFG